MHGFVSLEQPLCSVDGVMATKMPDKQLEDTGIKLLQQKQSFNGVTHQHQPAPARYMPELAAMFGKDISLEPLGTFAYPPSNYVGRDGCHVAAEEDASSEAVILDYESDEGWFFTDDFESYPEKDIPSTNKRKTEFPLGEDCDEEGTTQMQSVGCESLPVINTSKASVKGKLRRRKCVNHRASEPVSPAEKKRRRRILGKLQCLRNMIPCSNKENKSTIDLLDDTIVYLKYLQNQYLYFQLLSAEPDWPNPTPITIKPEDLITRKKRSSAVTHLASPDASNAVTVSANLGFREALGDLGYREVQLAVSPEIASWGWDWRSLNSVPQEFQPYINGRSSFAQELPITYDPKTLSIFCQRVFR